MNKNELIEKIQKLGDRIDEGRGRYSYEYDEYGLQAIISTVLDAAEDVFKTSVGREPSWSDKEDYLEIFSEAINKLR